MVRVIWPTQEQVDVWQAGAAQPTTLTEQDELDGLDVLPGFTHPVAKLFAL
ncbi:MAG: hypothetical protein ABI068_12745 [Ktedonobacterales bacterium]